MLQRGDTFINNVIMVISETPEGVIIAVRVSPGAKAFAIAGRDDWTGDIIVKVKSKAQDGKANQELVKELGKRLSAEIHLVAGQKSRRKKLLVKSDINTIQRLIG